MTDSPPTLVESVSAYFAKLRDDRLNPPVAQLHLPSWITPEMFEPHRAEVERIARGFGLRTPIEVHYVSFYDETDVATDDDGGSSLPSPTPGGAR